MLSLLDRFRKRRPPFNIAPQYRVPNHQYPTLQSPLDQLPPELLLEIADWLPTSSVAIFGLCNRRLFKLLGRSSLAVLGASEPSSRALFWKGIGRDLIDTFFCEACERLYFLKKTYGRKKTIMRSFARMSRVPPTADRELYLWRHEHFTFEHVQVAMKLYRHNLTADGDMFLKSAIITRPTVRFISAFPSTWGFDLFEVLKIHDQICVRTQTWLFSLKAEDEGLPSESRNIGCEHIRWSNRNSWKTSIRFESSRLSLGEDVCLDRPEFIRCPVCFTEVHADIRVVERALNARIVIVTQWQYLVEDVPPDIAGGRRCYHSEDKRERFNFDRVPRNILLRSPSDCAPTGSIRDAFEQKTATPFDSILSVEKAWAAFSQWAKKLANSSRTLTAIIYDESRKKSASGKFWLTKSPSKTY